MPYILIAVIDATMKGDVLIELTIVPQNPSAHNCAKGPGHTLQIAFIYIIRQVRYVQVGWILFLLQTC